MGYAHFMFYLRTLKLRNLIHYDEDYEKIRGEKKARKLDKKTDGDEPPPGLLEEGRFGPIVR